MFIYLRYGITPFWVGILTSGLQEDVSRAESLASQSSSKANSAEIMAAQALNTANEVHCLHPVKPIVCPDAIGCDE